MVLLSKEVKQRDIIWNLVQTHLFRFWKRFNWFCGTTVNVNVKFPTIIKKDLAGKKAIFKTIIHDIKEDVEISIDDKFGKFGYKTLI